MKTDWPSSLLAKTRETLSHVIIVDPGGRYHLKNADGRFGWIPGENLLIERFTVHIPGEDIAVTYSSIDALIEAGWARD